MICKVTIFCDFQQTNTIKDAAPTVNEGFKRKLSKREKKQLKKMQENTKTEQSSSAAEKLYNGEKKIDFDNIHIYYLHVHAI